MAVYIIGDLHLSLDGSKPMHVFGENWRDHHLRIRKDWLLRVKEEDSVILAGDTSWAMRLEGAKEDLNWIENLPGKKILLKGNHDYWWTSLKRMREAHPDFDFIYNTSVVLEDAEFVGTRGWAYETYEAEDSENRRIFKREVLRLKASIAAAKSGFRKICVLHYPPFDMSGNLTEMNEVIEGAGINEVYFGHIHANFDGVRQGLIRGVNYKLISADYMNFKLHKIL